MTCTTMLIAGAQAEAKALKEENDRLRAENVKLRDAFADGECFCSDDGCSDPLPDNCPKLLPEVSRLRAEVAELREEAKKWKTAHQTVFDRERRIINQRDLLRAELGQLRMENDRLRAIKGRAAIDRLRAKVAELREERDELRRCLVYGCTSYESGDWAVRIDAILAKTQPKG